MVSIIVPVYNVERYLRACLQSIVGQTYKNLEIIILNDGSTDSTGKICDEFSTDPRVKVVHKGNAGLSATRNLGFAMSKGPYVIFIDSDDWMEANMVEVMVNTMEETDADIVISRYVEEYTNKKRERADRLASGAYEGKDPVRLCLEDRINSCVWNKLCRREVIVKEFPINRKYEDHATVYAWFAAARRAVFINDVLYHYRQRASGIIYSKDKAQLAYDCFLAELERYNFAMNNGFEEIGTRELLKRGKKILKRIVKSASPFTEKVHYSTRIKEEMEPARTAIKTTMDLKNRVRMRVLWHSPKLFVALQGIAYAILPKRKKKYGLYE